MREALVTLLALALPFLLWLLTGYIVRGIVQMLRGQVADARRETPS